MKIEEMSSWGLNQAIYDVIENGFSFDEETGEILFTTEDLEKLNVAFDEKLNNICGYIKYSEERVNAFKNRKNEIEENIKKIDNKVEKLKKYLIKLMETANIKSKELPDYQLGTRVTKSVNIYDETAVYNFLKQHPEYQEICQKTETKTTLLKPGLKKVLDTTTINGCDIVESTSVQIK